jgi:hypothetical protein
MLVVMRMLACDRLHCYGNCLRLVRHQSMAGRCQVETSNRSFRHTMPCVVPLYWLDVLFHG